jgi:hypothetical protein
VVEVVKVFVLEVEVRGGELLVEVRDSELLVELGGGEPPEPVVEPISPHRMLEKIT